MRARGRGARRGALLDALLPAPVPIAAAAGSDAARERTRETREKLRKLLRQGELDEREVELELADAGVGAAALDLHAAGHRGDGHPVQGPARRHAAPEDAQAARSRSPAAREAFDARRRPTRLVDMDRVRELAIQRVEQTGIVFIDEIDKVAVAGGGRARARTSRARACSATCCRSSRARRCRPSTAPVRTDHILFIAAGAFHVAKPSDLIPELQGRFPIRVELASLGAEDFVRILTEPTQLAGAPVHRAARDRGRRARVQRRRRARRSPRSRRP